MLDDTVVTYLADCIAATAHDFEKKSASKNERRRHRDLCVKVADIMEGKWFPGGLYRNPDDVVKRLREMAASLTKIDMQ